MNYDHSSDQYYVSADSLWFVFLIKKNPKTLKGQKCENQCFLFLTLSASVVSEETGRHFFFTWGVETAMWHLRRWRCATLHMVVWPVQPWEQEFLTNANMMMMSPVTQSKGRGQMCWCDKHDDTLWISSSSWRRLYVQCYTCCHCVNLTHKQQVNKTSFITVQLCSGTTKCENVNASMLTCWQAQC